MKGVWLRWSDTQERVLLRPVSALDLLACA